MENIEITNVEHSNKKTILIAAAAIVSMLLFLFIAILVVNSKSNKSQTTQLSSKPVTDDASSDSSSDSKNISDSAEKVPNGWKTYKNTVFSISYPQEWKIEELKFPNGDLGTSFRPIISKPNNPSFLITSSPASSSSAIMTSQKAYTKLGFTSSFITIDGIQAKKLNGTIPPRSASSYKDANIMQANHIYLNKGTSDYLLKYTYIGRGTDSSLEKIFENMISSFRLTAN